MSIVRVVRTGIGRLVGIGLAVAAVLAQAGTGVAAAAGPVDPSTLLGVSMTISGRITDAATGQGVAGMCVDAASDSATYTATSGSDGTYAITWKQSPSTSPETFGVKTTPYCGADGWWQAAPDFPESVTVTPEPGQSSATGIDLQTAPAGRITGKIVDDQTGNPVSGVLVRWTATGATNPRTSVTEVLTQPDGSYLLGGLSAGTYIVGINLTTWTGVHSEFPTRSQMGYLPDFVHHVPDTSIADAQQLSVDVGQSTIVNESIHPADSITGKVTDSTTGLPIPDVHVVIWGSSVWDSDGAYTEGFTDAQGQYTVAGLGPGTYQVCFEPDPSTPIVSTYGSACWKNQPDTWPVVGDPVQVDGFGTVIAGIDQGLSSSSVPQVS